MADKQLNINLNFTANTANAKQNLAGLRQDLDAITNMPLGKNLPLTDGLKKSAESAKQLKFHLQNAFNTKTGNIDFNRFQKSIAASGTTVEQLTTNLLGAGTTGEQAFMRMASAINDSGLKLTTTNTLAEKLGTTLKNAIKWQLSSSLIHGFMGSIQQAVGYAESLNASLNNIQIITGSSTEEMARFADRANQAAKALSTTTTQYTDAALIFYQQGLGDSEVQARTEATIKMANVTKDSVTDVSSYMTAIWNNFDDGSQSMEHYADVITALGATTASSSSEIASGLQQFAAIADTIGLSYDYATSALATLVATTRQAPETVGNSLRTIFSRIEGLKQDGETEDGVSLNKYSQALANVGVQILNNNGELKEADQILDDLAAKWDTIGKKEQVALAQTVGGVRQYAQIIALMDNWDQMQANVATARGAEGTLQEQADIYATSWEAARDRVKASKEAIYQDLLNDQAIIKMTNGFAGFLDIIDKAIDSMGGYKTILLGVSLLLTNMFKGSLINGINAAVEGIRNFTASLTQAGEAKGPQSTIDAMLGKVKQLESEGMAFSESFKSYTNSLGEINDVQKQALENSKLLTAEERARLEEMLRETSALAQQKATYDQMLSDKTNVKEAAYYNANNLIGQRKTKTVDNDTIVSGKGSKSEYEFAKEYAEKLEYTEQNINIEREKGKIILTATLTTQEELQNIANDLLRTVGDQAAAQNKVISELTTATELTDELKQKIIESTKGWGIYSEEIEKAVNNSNNLETLQKEIATIFERINAGADAFNAALGGQESKLASIRNKVNEEAEAQTKANQAANDYKVSLEGAQVALDGMVAKQQSLGGMMVGGLQGFSSLAMSISMLSSSLKTLNDEEADFTSKLMAMGMVAGSIAGMIKTSANGFNFLNNSIKGVIATTKAKMAVDNARKVMDLQDLTLTELKVSIQNVEKKAIKDLTQAELQEILTEKVGLTTKEAETVAIGLLTKERGAEKASRLANVGAIVAETYASQGLLAAINVFLIEAGPLLAILAGLAAAGVLVYNAFKMIQEANPQYQLEQARESAQNLRDDLNTLQGAVNDTLHAFDGYNSAVEALKNCEQGTVEWYNAVAKLNEEIFTLIDKYPELQQFLRFDTNTGAYALDSGAQAYMQNVYNQQAKALQTAQLASGYANMDVQRKEAVISNTGDIDDVRKALFGNNSIDSLFEGGSANKAIELLLQNNDRITKAEDKTQEVIDILDEGSITIKNADMQAELIAKAFTEKGVASGADYLAAIESQKVTEQATMMANLQSQYGNKFSQDEYAFLAKNLYDSIAEEKNNLKTQGRINDILESDQDLKQTVVDSLLAGKSEEVKKSATFDSEGNLTAQDGDEKITKTAEEVVNIMAASRATSDGALIDALNNGFTRLEGIANGSIATKKSYSGDNLGSYTKNEQLVAEGLKDILASGDLSDSLTKEEIGNLYSNLDNTSEVFATLKEQGVDLVAMFGSEEAAMEALSSAVNDSRDAFLGLGTEDAANLGQAKKITQAYESVESQNSGLFSSKADMMNQFRTANTNEEGALDAAAFERMTEAINNINPEGFKTAEEYAKALADEADRLANRDLSSIAASLASEDISADRINMLAQAYRDEAGAMDESNDVLQDSLELAAKVAEADIKASQGQAELAENYKDVNALVEIAGDLSEEAIKQGKKYIATSDDLSESYSKVRTSLAKMLNVQEEALTPDFILKNSKAIQKAMAGEEEGVKELYEALHKDFELKLDTQGFGDDIETAYGAVSDLMNNLPEGEINLDENPWIQSLVTLKQLAGESLAEIQADFANNGIYLNLAEAEGQLDNYVAEVQAAGIDTTKALSKDVETVTQTQDNSDTEEVLGYSAEVNHVEGQISTYEISGESDSISGTQKRFSVYYPEYTVTPQKSSETVNKTDTNTAVVVTDGYNNSSGGNFKNTKTRAPGGGGGGRGSGGRRGGGGGGRATRTNRQQKKAPTDEKDRYHVVKNQLEDLEKQYDKLSKAKDRAFGKARIKMLDQEIAKQKQQMEKQKQYIKEINDYYAKDQMAILKYGANFDANGTITNYDAIMDAQLAKYNKAVDVFNSKSTDDEAAKEEFEKAEKAYEEFKKVLEQYEETQDLLNDEEGKLLDMIYELQSLELEKIQYEVEMKVEIVNADELNIIDHMLNRIEDDAFAAADKISLLGEKIALSQDNIDVYKQGLADILSLKGFSLEDLNDIEGSGLAEWLADETNLEGFTEEQVEAIRDYVSKILDEGDNLLEYQKEMFEAMNDMAEGYIDNLDRMIDRMNHFQNLTDGFKDIVEITGRKQIGMTSAMMREINNNQLTMQIAEVGAQKARREAIQNQLRALYEGLADAEQNNAGMEIINMWKEQIKDAEDSLQDAIEDEQDAFIDALRKAKDNYTEAIDDITKDFGDAVAGLVGSFQLLADNLDLKNNLKENYLPDYEKVYDLSKLIRDVNNSIDDTDNIRGKKELLELEQKIKDVRDSGREVSQYEIDALEKQYELLLARQALEDAKNAKSEVRMQRDSEGNFAYVYTANEDEVANKEQEYEDKIFEYQQLNDQYINELEQKYVDLTREIQDMVAEAAELYGDDVEAYNERMEEIRQYAEEQYAFFNDQMLLATDNNRQLYEVDVQAYAEAHNNKAMAEEEYIGHFGETQLAILAGYENLEEAGAQFVAALEQMFDQANDAQDEFVERNKEAFEKENMNIENAGLVYEDFTNKMAEDSNIIEEEIKDMGQEFTNTFDEISNAISNFTKQYDDSLQSMLDKNTALAQSFHKLIAEWVGYQNSTSGEFMGSFDAEGYAWKRNTETGDWTYEDIYGNRKTGFQSGLAYTLGNGQSYVADYDFDENGILMVDKYGVNTTHNGYWGAISGENGDTTIRYITPQELLELRRKGSFATGGYTGDFGSDTDGRLAILHEKELVLNESDTKNLLTAVDMIRQISQAIDINSSSAAGVFTNLGAAAINNAAGSLEQNVHITAEFPNATDKNEILGAFDNLVNIASQYANKI